MQPVISVIIPSYNYSHYVSQAIESVRRQTYADWECLVIDDGSTDDTRKVVEKFTLSDSRIRYIYQDNRGLSAARNTGIRESRGEFLQFLDADDLIESRKFELQLEYLHKHPDVDIVYGEARFFSDDRPDDRLFTKNEKDGDWMPRLSGRGLEFLQRLIVDNTLVVSSPLIRRDVIGKTGFFNEELKVYEDWEYWIRCCLHNFGFVYNGIPETYTLIRYHAVSMSMNLLLMYNTRKEIRLKFEPCISDASILSIIERENAEDEILIAWEKFKLKRSLIESNCFIKVSIKHWKTIALWLFKKITNK